MSEQRSTGAGPGAVPTVAIAALFVTALITAQVTASKVLAFGPLPFSIPLTGDLLIVPGAVFAYALTFFASDCYAELYGKRAAQTLVNVAFVMNFVLLALVWLAIASPTFVGSPVPAGPFEQVLGASTGIVVGSLAAYVVSQNWDVLVFHRLREHTDGDKLWLRNVGSTATSQAIDTVIFIGIAFVGFQGMGLETAAGLAIGQYIIKLGIALVDTPFVYAVVGFVRSRDWDSPTPTASD
ncbi:queuosine precursor transporter [Halobacteriales archaeon Cl-PHB]